MIPQPVIIAHMLVMESTSSVSSLGLSWRRPVNERPSSCASPLPKTTPGNEPLRCSTAGVAIANATLITPKMRKKITEAPSQLLQRKVVSIRLPPKGVWKHLGAEASQDLLRRKSIDVLLRQKSEDACDELARTFPRGLSHRPISSGSPATSYQAPSAVA